jgi:hypothetical protein
MRLQNEEPYCHWRISLLKNGIVAGEKLIQSDEVAQRLAHLLAVDGNHIVVHPVSHTTFAS